ncbi:hypothetical protein NC651_011446 [Populus alba x Populus x berolinensis]|nr:hypothetical protein NC651_011446 [Populus alba x Populus x berolinensis]
MLSSHNHSLRWKFYFPRVYSNFWPNSSDDRFNL